MVYVIAVAIIWIIASFVVQSVVGAGVSPFLIAYLCNSLFIVYLPLVEGGNVFWQWLERRRWKQLHESESVEKETAHLLEDPGVVGTEEVNPNSGVVKEQGVFEVASEESLMSAPHEVSNREWSRREIAQVSLLICPFWFLAQFTFNLSLRYTTVTVCVFDLVTSVSRIIVLRLSHLIATLYALSTVAIIRMVGFFECFCWRFKKDFNAVKSVPFGYRMESYEDSKFYQWVDD